ncbi:unnamed protein product [Urochloa decumbens]|uniref:Uncharacterized protein n=1 Tax=Urochloa decumbens TaxID=240449 RepID=A0ABC9FY94_9POAL
MHAFLQSEHWQLDRVAAALGGHRQRAVNELLGLLVDALVHLEQLRLAVGAAVALEVGLEPGPLRDSLADAAHRVPLRLRRHDPCAGEDLRQVVRGLDGERAREVVALLQVGAGAVLLPLVAPELEAAPAALARQRRPALVERFHQVTDRPRGQRVAVVAVLRPALAPPPHGAGGGEDGGHVIAEHGAGEVLLLVVDPTPTVGVVGPHPVDAEVRRRLAGVREAAALPRVAERARPLRHASGNTLDSRLFMYKQTSPNKESIYLLLIVHHLLNKVKEIELLSRGRRDGEERK